MLVLLTIWTLFCVSTQTALCGVARGSSTGGDPQGDGLTIPPSFRKLLQDARPLVLKKCGKDCDKLDEDLFEAAGSGEASTVKELISKGADVSSTHGDLDATSLSFAAQEGHVDIVEILIEAGANVDAQHVEEVTALHKAAQKGHLDVAKVLVKSGATVDLKTDIGATPLIIAAQENNLDVAEFLVESGADVNARTDQDSTPLHYAAYAGNPKLVRFLLDNGAEIEAQDYFKQTPVFVAAISGSGEAIEVLKNAGADLSIKNKAGTKIEDAICRCLEFSPASLVCREGTCGEGEIERIKAILKG